MINRRDFVAGASMLVAGELPGNLLGTGRSEANAKAETISIDFARTAGSLAHFWEKATGSDRVVVGLRDQWRQDLIRVQRTTGFQSVRCHGLFDDEMGIAARGNRNLNFLYVDQIYDFMLEHGVRPFVELSFMPEAFASSSNRIFAYKGNAGPSLPKGDWYSNDVVLGNRDANLTRIKEAIGVAQGADEIVLVLGTSGATSREGWAQNHLGDRADIGLIAQQDDLAHAIFALGKPVVVLINGPPLSIPAVAEKANALAEGWYPGQEGGTALDVSSADHLFCPLGMAYGATGILTACRARVSNSLYANKKGGLMVANRRVVRAAHTQLRTVGISFRAHALAAVSVVSLCAAVPLTAAHAADQPNAAAENPQPSALGEIVVTGTRIQRNGFSAPTPTSVLSESDILRTGFSNIAETVDQLPQLVGSQTPTTVSQQVSVGVGGQNVLNLRNLGAQRTLVLLDGQRVTPSGSPGSTTPGTGVVDINNLPSQLIKRVDVVTGGASAAYGSGAVAGVVNFILDKKFTGFKVDVGGGETTYGDDGEYSADLTFGTALFGGRGHLLLSAGGERSNGVPDTTHSVRQWYDGIRSVPNRAYISQAKTPNLPAFITYPNVNIALWAPGGLTTSGPLKGTEFGPGGTPQQFQYGSIISGTQMVGGQTNDMNSYLALAETLTRYNLFGRMSYDLTDNIEGYAQILFGHSVASENASQYFGTFSANVNNPFIPAATDAQLRAAGVSNFNLGVLTPGIGSLFQYNSRTVAQATFGLNGALSGDWHWQVYYKFGESRLDNQLQNNINSAAISQAANVITGPGGSPACATYLTNPGCIPLNLFGTGVASAQAIAAVEGASRVKTTMKEPVAEGTISGEPFSLWAGPVSLTAGGNWRQESIATPFVDPLSLANGWFSANYKPTVGSYSVDEFFAETVVPLAKDQLFAKSLDLDAAVRETDYSTSGWVSTWKVGANYSPVQDVTFRGYRSRDIRAPNLGELYEQGSSQFQPNIVDPRFGNGTIAGFPNLQSGNVKLQPETSDQWGLGIVYRPSWLSDFGASVDYYNVTVNGEIATLPLQTLINDCLEGTVPQYCQFVKTGPTTVDGVPQNSVIRSITAPVNLQSTHQEGLDIEVDYRKHLADWISGWTGTVTLRSFASYTPTSTINSGVNVNGAPVIHETAGENAGGIPYWRINTSVDYAQGPITLSGTWRFLSSGVMNRSVYDNGGPSPASTDLNRIPAVSYFDLGLTYGVEQWSHQAQFYVRVTNLLNQSPPVISASNMYSTQTAPVYYDVLGRFFRAGIRFTF